MKFKPIKKEDIKFYFKDNKYFVSVPVPCDSKPYMVYMDMGNDNRPFDAIIADINLAYEMLFNSIESSYTKSIEIGFQLPQLLGYKRASSNFHTIG